jgi:hypothetical protein
MREMISAQRSVVSDHDFVKRTKEFGQKFSGDRSHQRGYRTPNVFSVSNKHAKLVKDLCENLQMQNAKTAKVTLSSAKLCE